MNVCACMICRARYHCGDGPLPGHPGHAEWPAELAAPEPPGRWHRSQIALPGVPADIGPEPAGTLPRSHLGSAPGPWMNTFPRVHECVSPPLAPGSVVVCGQCRTQRRRRLDGAVEIFLYAPAAEMEALARRADMEQRFLAKAYHRGEIAVLPDDDDRVGELEEENARLRREYGHARQVLGEVLEERDLAQAARDKVASLPEPGSAEWWARATDAVLEDGPAACTGCGLAVPAPDPETGLCRFCADSAPPELPEPLAGMVRVELTPPGKRCRVCSSARSSPTGALLHDPGCPRQRHRHHGRVPRSRAPGIIGPAAVAAWILAMTGASSAVWWLCAGLLLALVCASAFRK